jgi:transposase
MKLYIGLDWSENKHDLAFVNESGAVLFQLTIPHTPEGFLKLDEKRQQVGVECSDCLVGLETAHNLVIDFLWNRGYTRVYVIPPNVVKSSRGRFGQSGARTDRSDARLLADLLRTDRARLQPWRPDGLLTRQMRAKVSLIGHLTRSSTRLSNRLRAVLLRYYPAALYVFSDLTTQIALHFIQTYSTPRLAAELSYAQFEAFARQHRYPNQSKLPGCFARLQQEHPRACPEIVLAYASEASLLAHLLLDTVQAKIDALRDLDKLFGQHPDRHIFNSLPGAGQLLAPSLLIKFGDDRQRFPSVASVQSLAGTCPVTDASGKRKVIKFRRSCDKQFRHITQQWARCSLRKSAWANTYWRRVRPHCDSNSHAYRCLANRWLAIAWKLWQTQQEYDEDYHLQQCALRRKPRR